MASPKTPRSYDELAAAEEHLRLAQEAGEIGTWDWDLASGRMTWSAQMFRNMGLAPRAGKNLQRALLSAIHPDDRDIAGAAFAEFRTRSGPLRLEVRLAASDGAPRWVVFLGQVRADDSGTPVRMLGITIDSTRRRRIEEAGEAAVRESEQRQRELNERLEQLADERARQLDASRAQMQAFFDNSPDWLTLFRAAPDGSFVYEDLNRATQTAYGLPRDRVVGRSVAEILGEEQARVPLQHMRACVQTGRNQHYTARRTMAGVTRTIDVMFALVPEGQPENHDGTRFIISTARDLTEWEAIEERLRQSQKIEAVGQLTGGLAHDFNNLLTAIVGNLELLEERVAHDPRGLRYVGAAQRAAENGARLTEQLLAFSRRQHLEPRPVDLAGVIDGMQDLLARTIGPTIEVRTDLMPEPWPALVDPTQIEIAILNLAINARDAMPLGGCLTIETRNLGAGDPALPAEFGGGDCLRVTVRDTGSGMTEEVLRSAVEPFFTTKAPGKGSGLGLSQVYGTVRQSNGALHIESRLGDGTAVHLFLPRADGATGGGALDRTAGQEPAPSGRILVVDDDDAVREVTVQMLVAIGYAVAEVDGGRAALDALRRGDSYDLMVIDIAMPGLNGIETVRQARQLAPGLRVLYVTGYADLTPSDPQIGDEPVIRKPFRVADLTAAVGDALRREPAGDPEFAPIDLCG